MSRTLPLLLVACLAAACTPATRRTLGEQCELNSDCNTPLVCGLGRCHVACATDRDCPLGARCVQGNQRLGLCLLPDESTCILDSDCHESLVCRNERCVDECRENRDCPAGSTCVAEDGERACEPVDAEGCVRNSDCEAPLVCGLDQRCRVECREDRDCAYAERCEGGVCVLGGAAMDAGASDAGPSDAGPRDGGRSDAEPDAGPSGDADAGPAADGGPPAFECAIAEDCTGSDATFECRSGRCVVVGCADGRGDCDLDPSNGCEQPLDTAAHCGGCGRACPGPGAACGAGAACSRIAQLASGTAHHCYRWASGEVYCWGDNGLGQLGDGTATSRTTPARVGALDATDVAAGSGHGCAVRRDGRVVCWGDNGDGQLGDGTLMQRLVPVEVTGLPDPASEPAVDVSAGDAHSCAVTSAGALYCWGSAEDGRLGDGAGSSTPRTSATLVLGGHSWVAVAAGGDATCGVRADGAVLCFGARGQGQIGDGIDSTEGMGRYVAEPRRVLELEGAVDVGMPDEAIVARHACALTASGGVACWGTGARIGYGGTTSRDHPVEPRGLPTPATALSVGNTVSCAAIFGDLHCWGLVSAGYELPTFTGRSGVRLMTVGDREVCTLERDERLRCFTPGSAPRLVPGF